MRAGVVWAVVAAGALAGLAGCAGPGPRLGTLPSPTRLDPLEDAGVADAEPRIELIRPGGANKPYQVLGRDYVPITRDQPFRERGLASWYGGRFHGRRTASGEVYDMHAMTAAHPTLPIPSYARIRNPANGREVVVRINDRGPFHGGRIVDLSRAAAARLDLLRAVGPVEIERLTDADIRLARAAPVLVAPSASPAPSLPPPPPPPPPPIELVAAAPAETLRDDPVLPVVRPSPGFWIQLGAFAERARADAFQRRIAVDVAQLAPVLATFDDAGLSRVQAGPFASREEAAAAARRMRLALDTAPTVVERR